MHYVEHVLYVNISGDEYMVIFSKWWCWCYFMIKINGDLAVLVWCILRLDYDVETLRWFDFGDRSLYRCEILMKNIICMFLSFNNVAPWSQYELIVGFVLNITCGIQVCYKLVSEPCRSNPRVCRKCCEKWNIPWGWIKITLLYAAVRGHV